MKIDLRILIVPVMPFALLLIARLVFFVAGAEWSKPELAAFVCLFSGLVGGGILSAALFTEEIEIGSIQIGRTND